MGGVNKRNGATIVMNVAGIPAMPEPTGGKIAIATDTIGGGSWRNWDGGAKRGQINNWER